MRSGPEKMRPKLHQLHDHTEASRALLDEAAAQYTETWRALEELGRESVNATSCMQWDDDLGWASNYEKNVS